MSCKCQKCKMQYSIDLIIPDEDWEKISPQKVDGFKTGGLLCPTCICEALAEKCGYCVVYTKPRSIYEKV